ncbi:MAG: Sialidase B precursor [Candidatus Hydrogenedentes bacterium ADurb.Bin101]|jgi:photosystem II stability/assembly factor-like uncharacterized protein|nr:exo-alpha-sialidase [Candidatus Hydrogenedentota bacterium]OQC04691.1 MAG: Sialidase B precursor [Candidatus Hydrogenedentes bacterium ADurb.Bin101]HOC69813.1 sialidase family protein [Candidatus Hydrogenedentota bacterium]
MMLNILTMSFLRGLPVLTVLMLLSCIYPAAQPAPSPGTPESDTSAKASFEVVLELPPGEGNPRNSEGDFILLKDGGLLLIYTRFTGGSGDHAAAYLASRRSTDGGATWSKDDTEVVPNEGAMNVMSVSLLRLQDDSIALFYLRKNREDDCRPVMRISRDEGVSWGSPVECIVQPVGYYVVNNSRVIQLRDGRIVIPAARHALRGEAFSSRGRVVCYLSDDVGKTWRPSATVLEAPPEMQTGFQEPGIVQLPDGELFMLLRNSSGVFYQSRSGDGGDTWSEAAPTTLKTPVSPASFKLIPGTDALLLVWNDHDGAAPEIQGKRTPFTLAFSRDKGNTWEHKINLEDNPRGWYCYTAIAFTGRHVLLAYCAGDTRTMGGLALTRVGRIPLPWLLEQVR